jgi:hypothetical protein
MFDRNKSKSCADAINEKMRSYGLTLDDVATVGWEPGLRCPIKIEKCRRVARIWELMARLNLTFANLEANFG